ncbi:MAG: Flagellar motor switch protein FliM [Candidatus Poribacteria bacterium]|nr:Flagellar motor switch protein FliM [Candidatus Poribacteria bacterium]
MENEPISQEEIDALLKAMSDKSGESPEEKNQTLSYDNMQSFQTESKPILSQDEISVLLNTMSSEPSLQSEQASANKILFSRKHKASVEKYDFTMPSRLSKDHLKMLNTLHNSYARSLGSYFSMSLRTVVEIECVNIEQLSYGEYLSSLFDPTCVGVFSMKPLRGVSMLEIGMPLAFPIIDILLGGSGTPKLYNRSLTPIEETIITKVIEKALLILQESWERNMDLKIKLEHIENNPQFIQAATSGDSIILILLDVKINNARGMMSLCFPFLTIQHALINLRREELPSSVDDELTKTCSNTMQTHIRQLHLPISVRYAPSPVTLGELLELKKGDVIILQNAKKDQVEVLITGKMKYNGKPGMVNGKKAVQISSIESEEKSEVI